MLSAGSYLGPYRIIGRVGVGGMGEVYRARDTRLERDVAIKVLPQHFSRDPSALKRFQREAKALAALSHPNILTIYDIGEHNGVAFVVMEMLEGETLRARINRSLPSCDQAIRIISDVTKGLLAAHSHGIIHRDLKPENIFLTHDENIKILDFGLAKRFHSGELEGQSNVETLSLETGVGTILGTLQYMSPEQARGEDLDPKSDIFSTGTMLYELLTGKLPFDGPNPAAVIHRIVYEDCAPATSLRSDLPEWVDPVLKRALAKDRTSRYSSTAELLQDLQSRHATDSFAPKTTTRVSHYPLFKPRNALIAFVLVALLCVLGIWFFTRQAKIRWARTQLLPQIAGMIGNSWRDSSEAYKLAEEAEKYIPNDPRLAAMFEKISVKINITTDPAAARVYMREYQAPESEWKYVGLSPIEQLRVPIGIFATKMEKDGYDTVLIAATTFDADIQKENLVVPYNITRKLDQTGSIPLGMVRVSGAATPLGKFEDFFIDRYEVTNAAFQKFIDSGGYRKKEYWKHDVMEGDRTLSWEDAMKRFVDQTGRSGPSVWEGGTYPEGQGDYPVSGISWYEAAAYAEFVGKSLPTSTHWGLAAGDATPLMIYPQVGGFAVFAPFSNFQGNGPIPVGSRPGITAYGAYDMAGNVREWCFNEAPKGRIMRGGAWGENTYMFMNVSQAPAMDRSAKNGFRCAIYSHVETIPRVAFEPTVPVENKDYSRETPVSDSVFQVYKEQFNYDQTPLNARVESSRKGPEGWTLDKVTLDAAYGGERIIAYLFIPGNASPPYQTVIYFPGSASWMKDSSSEIEKYYEYPLFLSFIVNNGRAVLYPVYKGTFERRDDKLTLLAEGDTSHQFTELVVQDVKDFKRCIDYLETRPDLDSKKFAYYGMSGGAEFGAIIPAVEERLRASVLIAGGISSNAVRPEVYQVNYLPRTRIPTLMMNGQYDTFFPYDTSIKPMFDLLGTPKDQKVLKLYKTDHIPPRNEFIKETLAWLDRYLGPPNR